jgi:acyl carrier protein
LTARSKRQGNSLCEPGEKLAEIQGLLEEIAMKISMLPHDDVLVLVREGLLSVATVELPELTPDLEIADLGYNSVQILEFLSYIEEAAGVSLPQQALMTVETIADLVDVVRLGVSGGGVSGGTAAKS